MHLYSPHGGPLHCAHISSNYIKFDQGQKEIARFVARYIPDEVFKYLLLPMSHDLDALLNDYGTIIL